MRRSAGPRALTALAEYIRAHANLFVQDGARSFGAVERTRREDHIKEIANEIDDLAKRAVNGSVQYLQFEEAMGVLHAAGFFPLRDLVSDVAYALEGGRARVDISHLQFSSAQRQNWY